jgi:formate dehydrogenase major subunit
MAIVNITINGQNIQAKAGQTVLQAATEASIHIPTLCHHPALPPEGACRLCLVEIEKQRALQPSCTFPVTEGMVVHTRSPKVLEARKFVLTMLFSERNHFCMYCQKSGGDCELQNAAYEEGMTHWPLQPNWQPCWVDASHPYYVLDNNRCILCRRCVRACGELAGNFTLGLEARGAKTVLVADYGVPLGESSCVHCGTCVQSCPTGALIDRQGVYLGKEAQFERVPSTCVGCSVGCGIEMLVRDNQLVRIEGNWQAPVNSGVLCEVGRYGSLHRGRERLTTPLVRKNGSPQPVSWDEALDFLAERLGPPPKRMSKRVAALASTRLPAEALYSFKSLFGDRLHSAMATGIEEEATTGVQHSLVEKDVSLNGSLDALKVADCVVAIGVNLLDNHQVAGFLVKRNLPKGTQLIVIDPFENPMHRLTDYALQPKQGQDYALLLGIMAGVIRSGMSKGKPPSGFDLKKYTSRSVGKTTGIPAKTILEVARLIASAQKPVFVYGKGITQNGSTKVLRALIALARVVGASELVGTKGKANSLTACRYQLDKSFDPQGYKAVYLALGDDELSPRLMKDLDKVPFLAVQASYASPVTEKADVVLPVGMWAEQEGHYLNMDGRLQVAQRGLQSPKGVRSNLEVLQAVAGHLGVELDSDWRQALGQVEG